MVWNSDNKYKEAEIYAPSSFWDTSPIARLNKVGGCGAGKFGDMFVPDTMWGLRVTFICSIHDWMYGEGKTIEDKEEADRVFFDNLIRWIDYHTPTFFPLRWLRHRRALKYYEFVKTFGGPSFWRGKEGDG